MNVTTWGELTDEWLGREVIVRYEDAGVPLFEGQPSGVPHEWRGVLVMPTPRTHVADLFHAETGSYTSGFPDHALVQEVNDADADDR